MSEQLYAALKDALASARMEGYQVTGQTEQDCIRLLSGKTTVAELVREILSRPEKAV